MLAVLATIPSPAMALGYVVVFGCGSIGGMIAMSLLLEVPLALTAERFARAEGALRLCAALSSVTVGILLAWQIGVEAACCSKSVQRLHRRGMGPSERHLGGGPP